ncbi:hypothetical protein L484_026187 [Morus notabilis]|uniref:Uncharacterized protein n=1 Tax=Morus notabilis TaxID=981085 RepID=W9RUT8_9ROSA|nr:hypothetical protein L484_026187 [Morus notabilis]
MPDVVLMLSSNEITLLPPPNKPAFFISKVMEGVEVLRKVMSYWKVDEDVK